MCKIVLWVLDDKDYTSGCDQLHRHPLLSREYTCAFSLKFPERTNRSESSDECVHTIVLGLHRAQPNITKQLFHFATPV